MRMNYQALHLAMNFAPDFQSKHFAHLQLRQNAVGLSQNCSTVSGDNGPQQSAAPKLPTFRRDLVLPRLIPVGPEDINDLSIAGRWLIVRRLAKALRGERARGRSGHWTYSLNRHIGLLQAFKAERAALKALYRVDQMASACNADGVTARCPQGHADFVQELTATASSTRLDPRPGHPCLSQVAGMTIDLC